MEDEEIEAFAGAYLDAVQIEQQYAPKLQTAASTEEAQDLQREAEAEIETAVEEHGISMARFQSIAQEANANPMLRNRIQQKLQDLGGAPATQP